MSSFNDANASDSDAGGRKPTSALPSTTATGKGPSRSGGSNFWIFGGALGAIVAGAVVWYLLQFQTQSLTNSNNEPSPPSDRVVGDSSPDNAPADRQGEQTDLKKTTGEPEAKLAVESPAAAPANPAPAADAPAAEPTADNSAPGAPTLNDAAPSLLPAEELAARARQKLEANDFDGAVADIGEAMRRDESQAASWSQTAYDVFAARGRKLASEKQYQAAVGDFTTAISHATSPELRCAVLCDRAKAHAGDRATDSALADFAESIKLEPESICAHLGRADLYRFIERTQEAIDEYDICLRINPKLTDAIVARGLCKLTLAQLDEAVGDFESAAALGYQLEDLPARQLVGGLVQRGDAYTRGGKLDLAIADFETARRLAPNHEELWGARAAAAYIKQGEALARRNRPDDALAYYNRAVDLKGRLQYAALNNRGAYKIRLKRYDDAITDLSRAIEVDGNRADAYYNRHVAYFRAGKADQAEADLARARKLDPAISPPPAKK